MAAVSSPLLRIAVSGSTGLIGDRVVKAFTAWGHRVTRLVRRPEDVREYPDARLWNPYGDPKETAPDLTGFDVIIHLCGAGIAARRWSSAYKKILYDSRVITTRYLVQCLAQTPLKPSLLIAASAVGYYGDRPLSERLTEESPPGRGFLARLCVEWEHAARAAGDLGIRVVHARFGIVLSARGGMLARMLPAFRWGLGGAVGGGSQILSWIALPEIPRIFRFIIRRSSLTGPINVVAPHPVSNSMFTRTLARVLHRPAFFHVPSPVIRLAFGEMGEELLLSGQWVRPKKLLDQGYAFVYQDLEAALKDLLQRN